MAHRKSESTHIASNKLLIGLRRETYQDQQPGWVIFQTLGSGARGSLTTQGHWEVIRKKKKVPCGEDALVRGILCLSHFAGNLTTQLWAFMHQDCVLCVPKKTRIKEGLVQGERSFHSF